MFKVALLSHTPNPDETVALAAKLCYANSDIDKLRQRVTPEEAERFVKMLANLGHESPLEHTVFIFGIEGVSRSFLAEITRHRIASYSVQSQRYVRIDNFEYILPPAIEANPAAKEEYIKAMEEDAIHYKNLTELLYKDALKAFIADGMSEEEATKKAEKRAIEDARFVLPNACATKMVVTMNARSLLNFFSQRCCNRAQWEIRAVATEMLRLVKEVAPSIFLKAGPPCVSEGKCGEGKMTCGKAGEVIKKFTTEL